MFRSIKAPVNCAHFEVDAFHTFIILIANNAIHHLLRLFQKKRLSVEDARTHQSVLYSLVIVISSALSNPIARLPDSLSQQGVHTNSLLCMCSVDSE